MRTVKLFFLKGITHGCKTRGLTEANPKNACENLKSSKQQNREAGAAKPSTKEEGASKVIPTQACVVLRTDVHFPFLSFRISFRLKCFIC